MRDNATLILLWKVSVSSTHQSTCRTHDVHRCRGSSGYLSFFSLRWTRGERQRVAFAPELDSHLTRDLGSPVIEQDAGRRLFGTRATPPEKEPELTPLCLPEAIIQHACFILLTFCRRVLDASVAQRKDFGSHLVAFRCVECFNFIHMIYFSTGCLL